MLARNYLLALLLILPLQASAAHVQPFIDLLVWDANETNTSWATTINGTDTVHVIQANPSFNTRPGFKAGLLYSADDNSWDTTATWTHYVTNANQTIPIGEQVISSLFFSGSFFLSENIFFGAYNNWGIALNMFDLQASHGFHPTSALTLTPKIGVKGGTINQNLNITWNAIVYNASEKLTNNFTGIGPSFGLDAKWQVYNNFSVVGDISTALMYGRWSESDIYHRPATLLTTQTTIRTISNPTELGTMMMDYFLGLEWQHHGLSNVTVTLGYEMQYWPSQLRLLAVQQLTTFGDLTLQGATCGISIDL